MSEMPSTKDQELPEEPAAETHVSQAQDRAAGVLGLLRRKGKGAPPPVLVTTTRGETCKPEHICSTLSSPFGNFEGPEQNT